MYVCVSGAQRSLKRTSDPLEQKSQMGVSIHVGAGYQTRPLEEHSALLTTESSLQPPPPMELLIKTFTIYSPNSICSN